METPLYNTLVKHRNLNRASFHTPGHKSRQAIFPKDLLRLDYTELPDTDSLFEAEGAIHRAELNAAELFNTSATLFSAGGCTLCIQAMLRLVAPTGGKIICGRVIHRSAINTMALLGIDPVWVYPYPDAGEGLPGRIQPKDIESALKENKDAKAVYITSPDYFGVMADISSIAKVSKKYGVPLIVDNAHGAHLWYTKDKMHPINLGASMTACSAHKTLPVMTGGAWLNIADKKYVNNAKQAMALFASTSPSYPIMASIDLCVKWLKDNGAKSFSELENRVDRIRNIAACKGIKMPQGIVDPTRISLNTASIGMTGNDAADYMRMNGIEPEYSNENYLVLIPTPMNTEEEFLRLERAIANIPINQKIEYNFCDLPKTERAVSPREGVLMPNEEIEIDKSEGRIAAQTACPCPPGVPVVMPGEIITGKCIKFLKRYRIFSIKVLK